MKPSDSLLTSIRQSNHTADLADKLGEVALDSLLTDGVLKDLPILGTVLTMLRAGNDISAYFFAKKIIKFLSELESISEDDRAAFIEEHCIKGSKEHEHLGEVTLMLLEKITYPSLATMLGRAFSLMVQGKLSRESFEIYAYVIKDFDPYLARQMKQFYGHENVMFIDDPAAVHLANYGLVDVSILPNHSGTTRGMRRSYERTEFGAYFYAHIIEDTA